MRAARYYGIEDVRIEDVPEPAPEAGEIQIKVSLNGICGTDLHEYYDGPRAVSMEPHPLTGASVPVILGHEAVGIVSGIGEGVSDFKEGDFVVIEPTVACHHCSHCLAGDRNLCDTLAFHGYATNGGGLAEFTVVAGELLHKVPAGISLLEAAVIEPLAVSHHAIERAGARPGQTASIFGGGPIGIGILLGLRARGIDDVIVVEPAPDRQRVVEAFGARVIDPTTGDTVEQLRLATNGRGTDLTFETAGAPTTFHAAIGSTAKKGSVITLTSGRTEVIAPLGQLMANEITVITSYAYNNDFPGVIDLMRKGSFPVDSWVETAPMSGLIDSFGVLRRGEAIKLLIDPAA